MAPFRTERNILQFATGVPVILAEGEVPCINWHPLDFPPILQTQEGKIKPRKTSYCPAPSIHPYAAVGWVVSLTCVPVLLMSGPGLPVGHPTARHHPPALSPHPTARTPSTDADSDPVKGVNRGECVRVRGHLTCGCVGLSPPPPPCNPIKIRPRILLCFRFRFE